MTFSFVMLWSPMWTGEFSLIVFREVTRDHRDKQREDKQGCDRENCE